MHACARSCVTLFRDSTSNNAASTVFSIEFYINAIERCREYENWLERSGFFLFFRKEILINTIWRWGGREEGKESERIPWRAREDISIRICGCSTIILKRAYNLRIMELDYPVSFLPSFTLRFLSIRYSLSVSPLRPPSLFIENQNSGFDYRKLCGLRSAEQSCTIVAGQRKGIFDRFVSKGSRD